MKKFFQKIFRLGNSYLAISDQSTEIVVLPLTIKGKTRELFDFRISYLEGRSYIVIQLLFFIHFEIDFYW
jgi:hypothetical protein